MELSKFTEMKVTPKVYCARSMGLLNNHALATCGLHQTPTAVFNHEMLTLRLMPG